MDFNWCLVPLFFWLWRYVGSQPVVGVPEDDLAAVVASRPTILSADSRVVRPPRCDGLSESSDADDAPGRDPWIDFRQSLSRQYLAGLLPAVAEPLDRPWLEEAPAWKPPTDPAPAVTATEEQVPSGAPPATDVAGIFEECQRLRQELEAWQQQSRRLATVLGQQMHEIDRLSERLSRHEGVRGGTLVSEIPGVVTTSIVVGLHDAEPVRPASGREPRGREPGLGPDKSPHLTESSPEKVPVFDDAFANEALERIALFGMQKRARAKLLRPLYFGVLLLAAVSLVVAGVSLVASGGIGALNAPSTQAATPL